MEGLLIRLELSRTILEWDVDTTVGYMVHQRRNLKFVEPTTSHSTVVRKTVPGLGPLRYPNFRTQLPVSSTGYSKSASSDPLVRQEPMLFVRHSPQSLKITFTSPQRTTSHILLPILHALRSPCPLLLPHT